jgi:DNA-binding transcriptional MerR regulator
MAEPTPLHAAAETLEFSIRDLCRQFDATPRTLRFYEDQGLLEPRRRGQTRLYSPADRARLGLILRGKRLGFSLAQIAELIALYDRRDGGAAQLEHSLAAVDERIATLERQRLELDQVLGELAEVRAGMAARLKDLHRHGKPHPRLPRADDYDKLLRARVDGDPPIVAHAR